MGVIVIFALAILTLVVLVGVIIYDRRVLAKRKLILHHLWRIDSKSGNPVGTPVRKIKLMEMCQVDATKFATLSRKFSDEGIVHINQNSIQFTNYGKQYYEFKIKPEHCVR